MSQSQWGHSTRTSPLSSECIPNARTSEVFGSQKCDCKAQLDLALSRIQSEGSGCVVYLRQEGRGIGLVDKIRAYALQEKGADTVDANRMLGLGDDLRTYGVAARMLSGLGIKKVKLMTNNPEKVKGLTDEGIEVTERVNTIAGVNSVNRGYLQTKLERMNHQISESSRNKGPSQRESHLTSGVRSPKMKPSHTKHP